MEWMRWRGWLCLIFFSSSLAVAIDGEEGCIPVPGSTNCEPTPTPTATVTATPTPTATVTATPTPTSSATPIPTPTATPTPTPTFPATPSPTPTPVSVCPPGFTPRPIDTGILLLEPERWRSLVVSDRAKVESTAPVWVNSRHAERAAVVRENGQASAPSFNVVGKAKERHHGRFYGPVKNGVSPVPDPLQFLPEPNLAEMTLRARNKVGIKNRNVTLQPGIYRNDIEIGGRAVVTLEPGVYVIEGQLEVEDEAELIGRDVMLFFPTQQKKKVLRLHTAKRVTLSPPTSGIYRGIVIYQRRTEPARMRIRDSGEMKISGMIYSADGKVRIGQRAKGVMASQLISRRLIVKRQASASFVYDPALAPIGCYP